MRIKLDRTMCDGFGKCAEYLPTLISLDEWGYATLLGTGEVKDDLEQDAQRAILDCPLHAITRIDEESQDAPG